jgi:hypothetical protein
MLGMDEVFIWLKLFDSSSSGVTTPVQSAGFR